jgi:hypothetical protein
LPLQGHLEAFMVRLDSGEDEEGVNGGERVCEVDSDSGGCWCGGGGNEMSEGGSGLFLCQEWRPLLPVCGSVRGERLLWQRLAGVLLGGR